MSRLKSARVCILRTGPVDYDKRTRQIARLLQEAGAEVAVVSTTRESRTRVMGPGTFVVREVSPIPASSHPVKVVRMASNLFRNAVRPHLLSRAVIRAAREWRPDLVHCMNVDMLYAGFRAVGSYRFIYDSREHFATTGYPPWRVRRWWIAKETFLTPRAAAVFTVTPMIAEDLSLRYKIPQPSVLVNGNTARVDRPTPAHAPLRLIHQGRFFFDRHLEDVVEAVIRQHGRAVLTLQGWGEAEEQLRDLVGSSKAEDVVSFVPPSSPEEVVQSASEHDVGIIDIWPENDSHRWTGSNKLFDYMAAGLAELVTNLDYTRSVVETEGCGIVFDPPTVERLSECIRYLTDHPEEVERMKRNAVVAAEKYSWDSQAPVLYETYERALARGRQRHGVFGGRGRSDSK